MVFHNAGSANCSAHYDKEAAEQKMMSKYQRQQRVVSLLAGREYNHRDNQLRINQRILSTLVCGDSYEFRKVWEKCSKSVICFEGNKIFMDNYQTAYDGYALRYSAPHQRFSIPKKKLAGKIVDSLLSHSPYSELQTGSPTGRLGTKLYGITDSSLLVINFKSGDIICQADLHIPSVLKLKEISWTEPEDSFVLSSTLYPYRSIAERAGSHGTSNVVKLLALFAIQPLRFVCMLEITRDVFGKDAMDASLNEGFLIVMHRNEYVRFYDFHDLLEKHQITPQPIEHSAQLRINMKITELPSCLFETRSEYCDVKIGANPWHYIVSSYRTRNYLNVHSLESGLLAQNGILAGSPNGLSVEVERAVFHSDNSNRIIYICADEVRMLGIKQDQGHSVVSSDFTIPLREQIHSSSVLKPPEVTSSGRIVKRRFSQEVLFGDDLTIEGVSYEDELDLMTVCSLSINTACAVKGRVGLYHNTTGDLLKTIELDEPKPDYVEHKTALDRDTLIQVTKYSNGVFLVQVYRLFEKCAPDEFRKDHKPVIKHSQGCSGDMNDMESPRTITHRRRRGRRR